MEENINSIFGLDNTNSSSNISGVPFYLSMPSGEETSETANDAVIQSPPESTPQTIQQSSVSAVPSPPPLLAKPTEDESLAPPPLLEKPAEDESMAPPPLLDRAEEEKNYKPSVKVESLNFMQQAFKESETDNNVISQKVKVASSMSETVSQLSRNEQKLKAIESRVAEKTEEINQKNMATQSYAALKPAFESIQSVLDYQRENTKQRDFNDQHYTVAESQSLFDMTANQIGGMPYWRG
jgi:hypothetical protein